MPLVLFPIVRKKTCMSVQAPPLGPSLSSMNIFDASVKSALLNFASPSPGSVFSVFVLNVY